jgi:hypothetical protein
MKTFYIVDTVPGHEIGYRAIVDQDGVDVCMGPMGQENAELIAAAPMMLRALQRLTHPMADDDDLEFALDLVHLLRGEK